MLSNDLKVYKAAVNTDTSANGGRLSTVLLPNTGKGILPDITQAERIAGITRLRKVFFRNMNAANEILYNPKIMIANPSTGADCVTLVPGTAADTQGTLVTTREYGACKVTGGSITAGVATIICELENASIVPFVAGDTIAVGHLLTKTNDFTNREYHDNVTLSVVGTTLTITLATGDQVTKNYDESYTDGVLNPVTVCSVYKHPTNLEPVINSFLVNSGTGAYNRTAQPIVLDNMGTITDTVTLTFTSASVYNASTLLRGSIGSGNITTDFAPVNADVSRPLFTIKAAGFGGSFTAGDTIIMDVSGAAIAMYFKQRVTAGTLSFAQSSLAYLISGETV